MVTLAQFRQAAELIGGRVNRTPLLHSPILSRQFHARIDLKLENLQRTGSFKFRGASHKLRLRSKEIGPAGVVAASAGNHAQGVALAASQAGLPATIVMPDWASISKQQATKGYGGKVVLEGATIEESLARAGELAGKGMTFVHPFDDEDIITGQGTVALEILEENPGVDLIVVPVGGGGLISGVAAAAKSIKPDVRVVGVQASNCPSAVASLAAGQVTEVKSVASIADGISVKRPGDLTFGLIRQYVDEVVLVDDDRIAAAILLLLERKKILAEGSGAAALAAMMAGVVDYPEGGRVVLLVSGGNVDSPLLGRILSKGLIENGRVMRVWIQLDDIPGSLSRLLALVADLRANVLHIYHERNVRDTPLFITRVELELETRSLAHVEEIITSLETAGYLVEGCDPVAAPVCHTQTR